MKKIFILFLLIITSMCFGFDVWDESGEAAKLEHNFAEFIVKAETSFKEQGFKLDGLCWLDMRRIYKNSWAKYQFDLVAGTTYIFYTMTTGEPVLACVTKDSNPNDMCWCYAGKSSTKIIYKFTPKITGSYHYNVKSNAGEKRGLHYSYVDYIIK